MNKIPYATVQVSLSEFSYSFPVTKAGQKFIRLYFYPSSYNLNFLHFDAFFSVKAGSQTLLKDFKASVNADDVGEDTIMREYLVNIDQGRTLTIAFTPSLSNPKAYALINGIEVVSMPDYLFYTDPNNQQAMMLNGGTNQFQILNSRALETMYRINVGGSKIPPKDDTGMFRIWDTDVRYLEVQHSHSVSAGYIPKLIYKDDKNYSAPDNVYKTARNYGKNETSKIKCDLEVSSGLQFYLYGEIALL